MRTDKVRECDKLEKSKDTKGGHMFAGANGLEANEGNLHTRESSNCIP